ncbi:hypothetical protein IGJ63_000574 [Enterococcus sp. DIV1375a]
MTKRRLIKKIKDISDDTLEKEVFFQPGFEPEKIISGIKPEQQEKEMATLRERLAYYQKKETAFKKLQEENEQLKNQQETEKQALEEKNQALLEILNQKEHEIFELEEQLETNSETTTEATTLQTNLQNAEKQLTTVHNQMERLESELTQQVAELEKESAEQQQHIQTLHNQLAEEKGKLEKKGDITGMEKQVETLTTELEESTTTQQALQEQIEKLDRCQ